MESKEIYTSPSKTVSKTAPFPNAQALNQSSLFFNNNRNRYVDLDPLIIELPTDTDMTIEKIQKLSKDINAAYYYASRDLWLDGYFRTNTTTLTELMHDKKILLAKISNKIVGSIAMCTLDDQTIEFGMLFTHSDYQNRGIASELVRKVEELAKDKEHSQVQLKLLVPKNCTHAHQERLKQWYEKLGFIYFAKLPIDEIDQKCLTVACELLVYRKSIMNLHLRCSLNGVS